MRGLPPSHNNQSPGLFALGDDVRGLGSETLQNFKHVLGRFLTSGSVSKGPHQSELKELSAELCRAIGSEKIAFLDAALQLGISDKRHDNPDRDKHMKLVNWSLEQISRLPGEGALHNAIDKLNLDYSSPKILQHFNLVRRFLILYPPAAGDGTSDNFSSSFSWLQNASFSGSLRGIPEELQSTLRTVFETRGTNVQGAAAKPQGDRKNNQAELELQRARLLLTPDSYSIEVVDQQEKIQNPVVKRLLKEIPYPARQGVHLLTNFNKKVCFHERTRSQIVCRHLVMHRIQTQAAQAQGKFRIQTDTQVQDYFASAADLKNRVAWEFERKFKQVMANAAEPYLINNDELGATLIEQFKGMNARMSNTIDGANKQQESVRYIVLLSAGHVMSLQLRVKTGKLGHTQYVTEFYDPNRTNNHVRFAHTELNALYMLRVKDLFNHPAYTTLYSNYYPDGQNLSMMYVTGTSAQTLGILEAEAGLSPVRQNRKVTLNMKNNSVSEATLWFLLFHGFDGTLRDLTPAVQNAIRAGQLDLANIKVGKKPFGLNLAMRHGRLECIRAFKPFLLAVPEHQRAKVLAARSADGMTALDTGLYYNKTAAIHAFAELVELVPEYQRIGLLDAIRSGSL
ncbi:MAG: ShET2/EspL2 family type III secretion system effector toxin [Burkholderiales bacterium]|jgi:hypothetical protein|uniref:ShET2/EspL2 family type III secretion system effector toxin n=1 Tax=Limnobacter sp. TaxID=2003368 RepID=UPI0039BCAC71|nr:ShET2/EspL2 family type III secretion system effector toxin [Burkholderiales bacterium]